MKLLDCYNYYLQIIIYHDKNLQENLMNLYETYLTEIESRKKEGLKPKPIDDGRLMIEIISNIKDQNSNHRKASLDFFIYNIHWPAFNFADIFITVGVFFLLFENFFRKIKNV